MIANIYREYVEHPHLPSGSVDVSMPGPKRAKTMRLTSVTPDGVPWEVEFPNRRACLLWLLQTVPDALVYASNGEVSLCAGDVRELAHKAGVRRAKATT